MRLSKITKMKTALNYWKKKKQKLMQAKKLNKK